jgi:hypothetical protein
MTDRDKMLALLRDGRKPKPRPSQEEQERAAAQHALLLAVEMEELRARVPVTVFTADTRAQVEKLEALARGILAAHPVSESLDDKEEADWKELARTSRQMRPMLTAVEQAEARAPGFEKWGNGFRFRLTVAMIRVSELCSYVSVQQKAGAKARAANSEKARAWRTGAEDLTRALWLKRPNLRGNANETATQIYADLKKAYPDTPERSEVQKYLSREDALRRLGVQKKQRKTRNC